MMYYYDPNNNKSRRWAGLAALLYVLVVVVAFLFVSFDLGLDRIRPGEGLLIDFGESEAGTGEQDLQATDLQSDAQLAAAEASQQPTDLLTDERSDVTVHTPPPQTTPRKRETPGQSARHSEAEQPTQESRQVNQRALFPGRTAGSTAASEGPGTDQGNAGDPSGAPGGDHKGTGQGDSGIAYDLSGRSVAGTLPKPLYPGNESGKVIVDVTVDAAGQVTYASFRAQGSTTNSKSLVDAAVAAARKARFSQSESLMQSGTITYIFKLK